MQQTRNEEFWNWSTHFIGIILSIVGFPILIIFNNFLTPYALISILFFSFGLLFVYCSSTLYHYVEEKKLKEKLRVLDHISIYYLIAFLTVIYRQNKIQDQELENDPELDNK